MTTTPLPDIEAIVSQYLRQHDDVTDLIDERVYGEIPKTNTVYPLARVSRVGGAPVYSQPAFLDAPLVQVDVFGGTKAQAHTIAAVIQAALADLPTYDTTLGYVTGVELGSLSYGPDEDFTPPKPAYRFDLIIWARPRTISAS